MDAIQEAGTTQKKRAPAKRLPPVLDPEKLRHAELVTPQQMAVLEPALKMSRIRWHLFCRDSNGLQASGAVVQDGCKILLHRKKYMAWLLDPKTQRKLAHPAQKSAA